MHLLPQYLRILTHPIIHFLHFLHCIQFFSIYLKKISHKSQWGGLTPKSPHAYASDWVQQVNELEVETDEY